MLDNAKSAQLRISLAKEIRKLRCDQGLSQEELALSCNLHRTYISMLECAKKSPTIDALVLIASALNVRIADLLYRAEKSI